MTTKDHLVFTIPRSKIQAETGTEFRSRGIMGLNLGMQDGGLQGNILLCPISQGNIKKKPE